MNHSIWLTDLNLLLVRYSYMGIGADIASMSLLELWGVYRYLLRLAKA
jgi:hypothetical protein